MTFHKILSLSIGLAGLILAAAPERAAWAAADQVVARVDGVPITEAEMSFAEEEVGAELAGFPPDYRRRVILEYLVEVHLFAEAGEKRQYEKSPDFQNRITYYRLRALRDIFYAKEVQAQANDQAKLAYDEKIGKLGPEIEVRARYIPAKSLDDAKALIKQIKSGAHFEELAKKLLENDTSQTGGDLGYFSKGQMPKALEDAAFALDKGEISEPLQIDSRWIVIRLEDKRNRPVPTFDEAKDQVVSELLVAKVKKTAQELRKAAQVEILDAGMKKAMEDETTSAANGGVPLVENKPR